MSAEPEQDGCRPDKLPLAERRRRHALWIVTGTSTGIGVCLPQWQVVFVQRVENALRSWEQIVLECKKAAEEKE